MAISSAYIGESAVTAIYLGADMIYSAGGGNDYFKITNRTAAAGTITIAPSTGSPAPIMLKTTSDGTNWTSNEISASTTIALPADGYVMFDGTDSPNPMSTGTGSCWAFKCDVDHDVSGKISSLMPKTLNSCIFARLFRSDSKLIDASGLDLDIENLVPYIYYHMFYGCSGLIAAPALPSTHLANNCYQQMFYSCSKLTTAPALPSTTLAQSCYYAMFQYCSKLTTAPVLPASALVTSCYSTMFRDCTSLTSITCLAMTTASNATSDWVRSIATTGTLYVANGTSINWAQGNAGYPSTWTLQTYTP